MSKKLKNKEEKALIHPQMLIKAMDEYAQMVLKNLHKPPVVLAEIKPSAWVDVEKRLPDTYCSVLVYDPNNPFNSSMDVVRYDAYQKCFFFSGGDTIHPTHWQPLPEKPCVDKI